MSGATSFIAPNRVPQPPRARNPPLAIDLALVDRFERRARLLQFRIERDPVIKHETLALPIVLGIFHRREVIQDAAVEFSNLEAKTLHPRSDAFATNAARAIHRNRFSFALPFVGIRFNERFEIAEVRHLRINCIREAPQSIFETVAVIDHDHVVACDQFAPRFGVDRSRSFHKIRVMVRAERDDALFHLHFQATERRRFAFASFELHRSERAIKHCVVLKRTLEHADRHRLARDRSIDAFARDDHASSERVRVRERTNARCDGVGIAQPNEAIKRGVNHKK
jgi:hypothetical protein